MVTQFEPLRVRESTSSSHLQTWVGSAFSFLPQVFVKHKLLGSRKCFAIRNSWLPSEERQTWWSNPVLVHESVRATLCTSLILALFSAHKTTLSTLPFGRGRNFSRASGIRGWREQRAHCPESRSEEWWPRADVTSPRCSVGGLNGSEAALGREMDSGLP